LHILFKLTLGMSLLTLAGVTVYIVLFLSNPTLHAVWRMVSALIIVGFPMLIVSTVIYVLLFPVKLTEDGIIGHNARGKKQVITWPEMVYTERISNHGFPCFKLQSNSSDRYILIPTFLARFDQFNAELKTHGIDLTGLPQAGAKAVETVQTPMRKRRRLNLEQRREGKFIVITTERQQAESQR